MLSDQRIEPQWNPSVSDLSRPDIPLRYKKMEQLGEGTYGVVYKGFDMINQRTVALKKIKQDREDDGIPLTSIREIAVLFELKHRNIVELFDLYVEDRFIYLVFEFCDEDLKQFMNHYTSKQNTASKVIPLQETKSIIYQILQGLAFCHHHQILHRDIKPQNILINKDRTVKLADFGLARLTTYTDRQLTSEVVTLWYRAPEVLLGSHLYTGAIDIWSTAAIFGELLRREEMFRGECRIDQIFKIFMTFGTATEENWKGVTALPFYSKLFPRWKRKDPNVVFHTICPEGKDLILKMFEYNPALRITADEALNHPFFDSIRTQDAKKSTVN